MLMSCLVAAAAVLLAAELLDPLALPWRGGGRRFRLRPRSAVGWPFRAGPALLLFGIALLVFGRPAAAAAAAAVLLGGGVVGSNAKHRVLGEPLCFTDLALLREMVRHPGFYLGAIPILARVLVLGSLVGGGVLLVLGASRDAAPRMVGAGLMVASLGVVPLARRGPWAAVAVVPDLADDVRRHGLLAALSLYPLRRRGEAPLRPLAVGEAGRGEEAPLVVVVQCESFADPGWMRWPAGVAAPALPGLEAARARAHRTGRLAVSGFGAYTMRTEYGVLFGRGEAEL
ncbi:MAG: LTA synthase family protein, partial [Gluconacetobacter diazotrophicus]|nr:LTA synthase family protein [Gluconacetobacter diazotrophicus]